MDGNHDKIDPKLEFAILKEEASVINKMLDDEAWYEGERQGHHVSRDDPVVMNTVCDILLRDGLKIYKEIKAKLEIPL